MRRILPKWVDGWLCPALRNLSNEDSLTDAVITGGDDREGSFGIKIFEADQDNSLTILVDSDKDPGRIVFHDEVDDSTGRLFVSFSNLSKNEPVNPDALQLAIFRAVSEFRFMKEVFRNDSNVTEVFDNTSLVSFSRSAFRNFLS